MTRDDAFLTKTRNIQKHNLSQKQKTLVTKLRKNLAEEYLRYLSERDARKILTADLNELRYQREDMSLAQSPGIWGEDPMKLTLALKMARQDLTRTQMELNTMKASFGDVVPKRDFEVQEKTNKDLQEQVLVGRQGRPGRAGFCKGGLVRISHLVHS